MPLRRGIGLMLLLWTAAGAAAQATTTSPATAPATQAAAVDFPPITVQANAIAPDVALGKIVEASGAEIVTDSQTLFTPGQGQTPGAMFVDVRHKPFWLAMDQVCRGAGVGVRGMGAGDARIMLFERNDPATPLWGNRPYVVSGPALLVPETLTRTDRRDFFRTRAAQPVVSLAIDVWLDPRLKAMTIAAPARVLEAVDEGGVPLPRDPSDTDAGGPNGAAWMQRMNLRLHLPSGAGARIAYLRGEVTFVTVSRSETWEIGKAADAKGKTKTILGFSVEVQEVTLGDGTAAVRVGTERGGKSPAEWGRFLQLLEHLVPQMRMLDEAGEPMRVSGWGSSSSDKVVQRSVDFNSEGEKKAKPTKIVWVVPTETREVTLPFELKDLVLP